ncbi:hypothetical protein [Bernardetia sp.]|uniref:hypothetical protein n=1 Tax=Bernardetia sp. TaxID=1937974 RepID=UPI0025C44621|nr:hypothetical protein [Bernardetia sp.]
MLPTNFFTSSRNHFMGYFMLLLVVFSTTMRFANGEEKTDVVGNNFISLLENTEADNYSDTQLSDENKEQREKEPLTLKSATSSEALLQGFVITELFYNIILTPSIEFIFPSFSIQKLNSVTYYFSSSGFFKTLFNCFISPNAP